MGVNVGGHGVLDRGVTGGGGGAHVFCDEVKHYRCKQLTLQPRTPGTYNGEPPTPLLPPSPLETGPPFSGEGVPVSCLLCPIADPSPAPLPPPHTQYDPQPTRPACDMLTVCHVPPQLFLGIHALVCAVDGEILGSGRLQCKIVSQPIEILFK